MKKMKNKISAILEKGANGLEPLIQKISSLTKVERILICCGSFILLAGVFAYFLYLPKYNQMDLLKSQRENLKKQLVTAKDKARRLEKYRKEMADVKGRFNAAMKALPDKKEIPSLLASVSQAGRDAGLAFLLFQPKSEVNKEFYAEIPVQIEVTGTYHQTALFFDKVSRLSRVVNIKDIKINTGKKSGELKTSCAAVTYRFVEQKKNKPGKKRKRRR